MTNSEHHDLIVERNELRAALEQLMHSAKYSGQFSFSDYNEACDYAKEVLDRYEHK